MQEMNILPCRLGKSEAQDFFKGCKCMAKKITKTKQTVVPPPKAKTLSAPAWFTNARLHTWMIFITGFALYINTLEHNYTQDDAIVITDNMFTTQGVAGIPGILQYDTFYGFFKEEGKAALVAGGRYRPLTLVLFAIEYQLFGQNPFVGHLLNALLYGLTGCVLYWLLLQLLCPQERPIEAYFVALAASLLFLSHPVHTEAVANIKGRDEIVALLGALGALYLSLRAYATKEKRYHILAGVLFLLALLSKENAITFVVMVPLTFWFFTKAKGRSLVLQTLPFALGAVVFLAIRASILGGSFGDPPKELMNNPFLKWVNGGYIPFTADERLATVIFTLGKYLQLLFWPHPLTHDYYPRHIDRMTFGDWRVLLSLLIYSALALYALLGLRRRDSIAYGIWFYLLTLSIVSNIVFPVGTNMAERLLFMPSAGFTIAIAALVYRLSDRKKIVKFEQLYPVLSVLVVAIVAFSAMTIARNSAWKDNFTLFTTDIHTSPNSAKLRNAVGGELIAQAAKLQESSPQKQTMLQEAVGHLQEAVRIHPLYKNAWLLLGNAYNYLQQYEQSAAAYREALRIDPGYREASDNLTITLQQAGRYFGEQQQNLSEAIRWLEQAYQLNSENYETVRLLGVAYGLSANSVKAIEFFERGVALNSNDADAWFNLGSAYYNAGNSAKGEECIRKAEAIEPDIRKKRAGQQ